jgi:hypothetical protein
VTDTVTRIGTAGVGALAGAWFGPVGIAVGAAIGGAVGKAPNVRQVTFEIEFNDGRGLIGTTDETVWTEILESWKISHHAKAIADILPPQSPGPLIDVTREPPAPTLLPQPEKQGMIDNLISRLPWRKANKDG